MLETVRRLLDADGPDRRDDRRHRCLDRRIHHRRRASSPPPLTSRRSGSATTCAAVLSADLPANYYFALDTPAPTLGEAYYGAGRGVDDFAYVTVSTGIGAGVIAGGRLFTGGLGWAGGVGHVIVDPNGPRICDACGNRGCLETYAAKQGILALADEAIRHHPDSLLARHAPGTLTPQLVCDAARAGDEAAIWVFGQAGYYLGLGLTSLVNILSPKRVVVGGGIALAGDLLLDSARAVIRRIRIPAGRTARSRSCRRRSAISPASTAWPRWCFTTSGSTAPRRRDAPMQVDLSIAAGFPLTLDTETGELTGGGALRFGRVARRLADLQPVLFEADGVAPDTEVYWTYPLLDAGPAADDPRRARLDLFLRAPAAAEDRPRVRQDPGPLSPADAGQRHPLPGGLHPSLGRAIVAPAAPAGRPSRTGSTTASWSRCARATRSRSRRATPTS